MKHLSNSTLQQANKKIYYLKQQLNYETLSEFDDQQQIYQ